MLKVLSLVFVLALVGCKEGTSVTKTERSSIMCDPITKKAYYFNGRWLTETPEAYQICKSKE